MNVRCDLTALGIITHLTLTNKFVALMLFSENWLLDCREGKFSRSKLAAQLSRRQVLAIGIVLLA